MARELTISEVSLARRVTDERVRMQVVKETEMLRLSGAKRTEMVRLRNRVLDQEKNIFLRMDSKYLAANPPKRSAQILKSHERPSVENPASRFLLPTGS